MASGLYFCSIFQLELPDAGVELYEQTHFFQPSFTCFEKLPAEIRHYIWRLTFPVNRTVNIQHRVAAFEPSFGETPSPAAFIICRESRSEALRCYRDFFEYYEDEVPTVYYHPDLDTVYLHTEAHMLPLEIYCLNHRYSRTLNIRLLEGFRYIKHLRIDSRIALNCCRHPKGCKIKTQPLMDLFSGLQTFTTTAMDPTVDILQTTHRCTHNGMKLCELVSQEYQSWRDRVPRVPAHSNGLVSLAVSSNHPRRLKWYQEDRYRLKDETPPKAQRISLRSEWYQWAFCNGTCPASNE